jgi:release factor glutamine methyltransferase
MSTTPPPVDEAPQNGASWDVGKITSWSQKYLQARGFSSPRLDSELLLAKTLDLSRIGLYTHYDRPISPEEQKQFGALLRRRVAGEPVAYLLGYKDFMDARFRVGPEVLIPRPETELLVEQAIAYLKSIAPQEGLGKLRVLDVGTGSGCIAISIARALPFVEVVAWDICEKALSLACANARDLGVGQRVAFHCVDALSSTGWEEAGEFHLLISNPPYIRAEEIPTLSKDVKDYEPLRALQGGEDGLVFYRCMAEQGSKVLSPGGMLLWEIGASQGAEAVGLLTAAGWLNATVSQDYSALERMVSAVAPGSSCV